MRVKIPKYLDVRNLNDEAGVRIPLMAFVTLPKQLCTSEGDNTLVRTVLLWIKFDVPCRSGTS